MLTDAGVDFIAMEYVAGKALDQVISRKGMRINEALKVAVQGSGIALVEDKSYPLGVKDLGPVLPAKLLDIHLPLAVDGATAFPVS